MKPSILVLDELEILRAQLDEILTKAGYGIRLTKTFAEAIERTQRDQFDALLLDVACIPNSSAQELQAFSNDVPIILTTTRARHDLLREILQLRPDLHCIEKPFTKSDVLGKLAHALRSLTAIQPPNDGEEPIDLQKPVSSSDEPEKLNVKVPPTDIARLHMTIERVSEARGSYLKCLQQQERNNRIGCDEYYRILEHARADLETQLNHYIDMRIKSVLCNYEPLRSAGLIEYVAVSQNREFANPPAPDISQGIDLEEEISRYEIDLIKRALELTGGHQSRAARLLRMNPTTLNSKIKKYGIVV